MPTQVVHKEWTYNFVGTNEAPANIPDFTVYIEVQSTDEETAFWGGGNGSKSIYVGSIPRPH